VDWTQYVTTPPSSDEEKKKKPTSFIDWTKYGVPPEHAKEIHTTPSSKLIPSGSGAAKPKSIPQPQGPIGAVQEFATTLGVPTSKEQLKSMQPQTTEEKIATAAGPAGLIIDRYLKGVYKQDKESGQEIADAIDNILRGDPLSPNIGKAVEAEGRMAGALLAPIGGEAAVRIGENIGKRDYWRVGGGALGLMTQAVFARLGKEYTPEQRAEKLTYVETGVPRGGEKINYFEANKAVMPELVEAAKTEVGHPPVVVGDLVKTINGALDKINNEYGLASQSIQGREYVPTEIADAIRNKMTEDMVQTAEDSKLQKELSTRAGEFDKMWTWRKLDAERQKAYHRLDAHRKASAAGQRSDAKLDADAIADSEISERTKDLVYGELDRVNGKPQGYYAALKKKQSQLLYIKDRLAVRVMDVANLTAAKKGTPTLSGENVTIYGTGHGRPGLSIHRLMDILRTPEKAQNIAVKQAFKGTSKIKQLAKLQAVMSMPLRILIEEPPTEKSPVQ